MFEFVEVGFSSASVGKVRDFKTFFAEILEGQWVEFIVV